MRASIFLVILLLTYNVYANEKSTINHIEDFAEEVVNDIKKDGDNLNYFFEITNVKISNGFESGNPYLGGIPESVLFGTFGVVLLPNTWKINISYSGELGKNIFMGPPQDELDTINNSTYVIDHEEKNVAWIDFYMKPLSTKYGDFGFGYKYNEQNNIIYLKNDYTLFNYQNATQTGAQILTAGDFIRDYSKFETVYLTYNFPFQNSWYDGLGISYGYEMSNNFAELIEEVGFVLNPDTKTTIFTIGINKTLAEINSGLGFKTFQFGVLNSEIDYFNYNTSTSETFVSDGWFYDIEVIYMFKPGKNKQFYISGGRLERIVETGDRDEYLLEVGMKF